MKKQHLTILKIGGSCITYKDQSQARLRRNFLMRMAQEIALGMRDRDSVLIVVHGGGGMTHPLLDYYRLSDKLKHGVVATKQDKNAAAKIHVAMNDLNNRVTRALQDADIPAWPIQTSAVAVASQRIVSRVSTEAIRSALQLNIVPVLHGDLVLDIERGSCIFSGDAVACMLSRDLEAERLLFMSDVNGIYSPAQNSKAPKNFLSQLHIMDPNVEEFISNRTKGTDHSGGMREKIHCIKTLCSHADVRIFSGLIEGNISKALRGESIGTEIIY